MYAVPNSFRIKANPQNNASLLAQQLEFVSNINLTLYGTFPAYFL